MMDPSRVRANIDNNEIVAPPTDDNVGDVEVDSDAVADDDGLDYPNEGFQPNDVY